MNEFKNLQEMTIEIYNIQRLLNTARYGDIFNLDLPYDSLAAKIRNQFCQRPKTENEELNKIKEAGNAVGKELAERKFTEKELTSFGQYLLSAQRTKMFVDQYNEEDNISLEERLAAVYDSDMKNWYHQETQK